MGFVGFFFALPSLLSRDNTSGFGDIGVEQTCVFAACRAGYRRGDRTNFMRWWCKPDASMERGWYGLGARKVYLVLKYVYGKCKQKSGRYKCNL